VSKAGARPSHVCCCCNLLPLSQSCLSTATGRSRVRGSRLHCTSASSFTPQSPVAAPSPTPPANVTHPPMATDAKPDQPRASTPTEVVVYRPQATGRVPQATGRVPQATGRVPQATGRVSQATGRVLVEFPKLLVEFTLAPHRRVASLVDASTSQGQQDSKVTHRHSPPILPN